MKKVLTFVIAGIMSAALFTGCAAPAPPQAAPAQQEAPATPEAEAKDKYVVGISVSGFQAPYFNALIAAAEEKAKEYGNVELKVLDAEWDTQKQASQIESLIQQKCDVIEVIPCDSTAVIPSMQKVKDAGIPLFIVNTQHDPSSEDLITTYIGASMEDEAAMCADAVKEIANGEEINVVIVEGAAGSFPGIHRTLGFEAAIADAANVKVIAKQNAGWDRPTAQKVTEDFLTRYPDIDVLYAHDDNMAIGAIQAIKAAGRMEQIKVVSISGTIEGLDAIKANEMVCTVEQSPVWEGKAAVEYAVRLLDGETLPKWIKTEIQPITAENVNDFKGEW